ncbi:(d)CMP kinase [Paucihalobacter ruber]|uniref:Cytidylate kinase n=1 Tax=Paucihalobacter ruber TaxID=2567861 RepID=A0A506PF99_9FLAO|nr:(d)CMP kinase [Paucihalobacter ruber]TPV32516.1 (d)CMP kinase [Paucihalobacter ruber]
MNKKIIIAIDGFSSTGKSTVAKQLAAALRYIYVDSGAMYRAVTFYALENDLIGVDFFYKDQLIKHLERIRISFKFNAELGFAEVYLNGQNIENEIRTLRVSNFVSKIAEISEVRKKLVEQQQEMGKEKGIVMDGRDIGTVVFPEAELKIFMTASAETRAKRRLEELQNKGQEVNYQEVLKNIEERDFIDTNRDDSPLAQAEDAVLFDNSNLSREEQFNLLLAICKKAIQKAL